MPIELKKVTVSYDDHKVLNNISLKIEDGGVLYLLGASGAGKTTLLRVITGLETPTEGSVHMDTGSLSVVFQEPRLFPTLTVAGNIQAVNKNIPVEDIDALLSALDLLEAKNKFPHELSGGMQKRTALARALAVRANLYVFDEPTGGQDKVHTEQIADVIKTYTKGKSVLIATHDEHLQSKLDGSKIVIKSGQCFPVF